VHAIALSAGAVKKMCCALATMFFDNKASSIRSLVVMLGEPFFPLSLLGHTYQRGDGRSPQHPTRTDSSLAQLNVGEVAPIDGAPSSVTAIVVNWAMLMFCGPAGGAATHASFAASASTARWL